MYDGMSIMYYIINMKKYINYLLVFSMLVPILINGIILYLLHKKGKISIPSQIAQNKILAIILNRFIIFINRIKEKKSLISYFKSRCKSEIFLYVVIFIIYLIIKLFI